MDTSPDLLKGIQVDFDDGHCPTVKNQLKAYENISEIIEKKDLSACPIMMFRPRAFNMNDHLIEVNGQPLNGGLMDFAIIMFNTAKAIIEKSPSFEDRQVIN